MKIIKQILCFMCIMVVALAAGCGNSATTQSASEVKQQPAKAAAKEYQRIVSLSVGSDEIILDLLPRDKIAAVSISCLRPEISNAVAKAKLVENTVDVTSPESILRVQPDLVIIPSFVRQEVIASLQEMGIEVYVYPKQNSFAEIRQSIIGIAQEVGRDPAPLLNYMDTRLAALEEKIRRIPDNNRKRIVYLMSNGIYVNPVSPYQDICKYAGVKDAAMELGYDKKTFLSKEQMVKLNPDVIVVADFNWDGKSDTKTKIDEILHDKAYKHVKAVQNKQVVSIPGQHIYSLSHHIVEASEDMAKAVYPELFK